MLKRLYNAVFGSNDNRENEAAQIEECNIDIQDSIYLKKHKKVQQQQFTDAQRMRMKNWQAVQSQSDDGSVEEEDGSDDEDSDASEDQEVSHRLNENSPIKDQGMSDSEDQDDVDEDDSWNMDGSNQSEEPAASEAIMIEDQGTISRKRSQKLQAKASAKKDKHLGKEERQAKKLLENASVAMLNLKQGLNQSFKSVVELNCPICMDYIVSCRTAICGHSFCEACINESLIHRKECPNCRKDIRKWVLQKSDIIDSAVKLMIKSRAEAGNDDEIANYEKRLKQHHVWLDKQTLKELRPGEEVDALDTEYIWCKAQVELKITAKGRPPLLYLHYDGWSRKYDEYMYMDSRRIAPVGAFTNRTEIPRYQRSGSNRTPMNYAHVIDPTRNMDNQHQVEILADENGVQNDLLGLPQLVQEEPEQENEASYDSLNGGNRDEPEGERQGEQAGSSARAGGRQTTSLNRDSHVGRSIDVSQQQSQTNAATRATRPSTRNARSTAAGLFFQSATDRTFAQSSPFFSINSRMSNPFTRSRSTARTEHLNPFTVGRQNRQQQQDTSGGGVSASTTSRLAGATLNRHHFQFGTGTQTTTPSHQQQQQQQSNSGESQGAGGTRSSIFDAPATYTSASPQSQFLATSDQTTPQTTTHTPLAPSERGPQFAFSSGPASRRLPVPGNNTGNIMRGSGQSNAFGQTSNAQNEGLSRPTSHPFSFDTGHDYQTSSNQQTATTADIQAQSRCNGTGNTQSTQTRHTTSRLNLAQPNSQATSRRQAIFHLPRSERQSTAQQRGSSNATDCMQTCPLSPPTCAIPEISSTSDYPHIERPPSVNDVAAESQSQQQPAEATNSQAPSNTATVAATNPVNLEDLDEDTSGQAVAAVTSAALAQSSFQDDVVGVEEADEGVNASDVNGAGQGQQQHEQTSEASSNANQVQQQQSSPSQQQQQQPESSLGGNLNSESKRQDKE